MTDAAAIEARVRATGLLAPGRRVLVLVSAGRDSTCLLDLAVRIAGASAVTALHVDHGLREDSAADARHCAGLAEQLGVELLVHRPAAPPEGNVQAWARDQRYALAARLALERGADVAAGHTATDQVETVLYRLAASPGRRALLGMRAREGRLVRPLLDVAREETGAYCDERGLSYRDDPSNEDPRYARNRVRNALLESMRSLHDAAEENVLRTLSVLRDEATVLEEVVEGALRGAGWRGGPGGVSAAALREMAPAVRRLALQRMADAVAGEQAPAVGPRADEILELAAGDGSRSLDVGGGLRAQAEYGELRFVSHRHAAHKPPAAVELALGGRVEWAGGHVRAELGADLPVGEGTLDAATLDGPLELRSWRPGDRMRPLGLGGSRSLQDLFTDRKVPREQRHRLPVVTCGGEIVWVGGVATAEPFKVTDATVERVRLGWEPERPRS